MKLKDVIQLTEKMGPYAGLGSWASRKENPFDSDTKYFAQQAKKGVKKLVKKVKDKFSDKSEK